MGCSGFPQTYGDDFWDKNSNGCFSGNGKVKLMNNKYKTIKNLTKGDTLENGAEVQCLVITKVNKTVRVVELNGVYYT